MGYRIIAALAALAVAGPVLGQEKVEPAFNKWICTSSPAELFDMVFDNSAIRVNNISLGVQTGFMTEREELSLSYTATNRGSEPAPLSLELVVIGNGEQLPQFAISGAPVMDRVGVGKTEQVQRVILRPANYTPNPENKACVRITD